MHSLRELERGTEKRQERQEYGICAEMPLMSISLWLWLTALFRLLLFYCWCKDLFLIILVKHISKQSFCLRYLLQAQGFMMWSIIDIILSFYLGCFLCWEGWFYFYFETHRIFPQFYIYFLIFYLTYICSFHNWLYSTVCANYSVTRL